MATQFTSPQHSWSVGEVVTAANMNTFLRDNMGVVGTPPLCIVQIGSTQTFTSGSAETQLNWGNSGAYIDTVGGWSPSTQTYTVAVNGWYEVNLSVLATVASGITGVNQWQVAVQKNGSDILLGLASTFESTSETCRAFGKVYMSISETFKFTVYNGAGVYNITTVHDPAACFAEMRWFSA